MLKSFVNGDNELFDKQEQCNEPGFCFSKSKFLRDLKSDKEELNRTYFPHTKFEKLKENEKEVIISEIENEFKDGLLE